MHLNQSALCIICVCSVAVCSSCGLLIDSLLDKNHITILIIGIFSNGIYDVAACILGKGNKCLYYLT